MDYLKISATSNSFPGKFRYFKGKALGARFLISKEKPWERGCGHLTYFCQKPTQIICEFIRLTRETANKRYHVANFFNRFLSSPLSLFDSRRQGAILFRQGKGGGGKGGGRGGLETDVLRFSLG